MRQFILDITDSLCGKEIKYILKTNFCFSAAMITRLKNGGGIFLNGERVFVNKLVSVGDRLSIILPESSSQGIVPNNIPLDILHEDEDLLAVNKPYNMPTHPSHGHFEGTLANAVCYYYKDAPFTFRAVTRLDRETSGVVLIAKNAYACARLSEQLRAKELYKEYLAICVGTVYEKSGRISAPIRREHNGIIKRCISQDGKPAVSDYTIIDEANGLSLARLVPRTGRTHQLRLHMVHIGIPILGDSLYGIAENRRLFLHCRKLNFIHPINSEKIEIIAPVPHDMDIRKI
ncbi:MAG: RluA family pseudouridine synthase [Firmicutes bacterium]|nr:RluA family pseudouridine synthase [Bacillota bacterium]